MRRARLLLMMLVGCGSGLSGVWDGQCTIDDLKGEARYDVSYSLTADGDALSGTATAEAPFLTEPIEGDVVGTVERGDDGRMVSLTAELGDVVLGFTLRHDLVLDEDTDTMAGTCSVQVLDEKPFEGRSDLARSGDLPEEE